MEVLRAIKNNQFVSSTFASFLISVLELQIICMLLIKLNSSIYGKIMQFFTFDSAIQIFVLGNFGLNFIQSLFLAISVFLSNTNSDQTKSLGKSQIVRLLQIKHYFTIVQIISINSLAFKNEGNLIKGFAAFNIIFVFGELFVLKIISISYRFIEKNFLRRRNSSIVQWGLILPIIASMNSLPIIYSCLIILLRAAIQLFNNLTQMENQTIRKLELFYPFLAVFISIVVILNEAFGLIFFDNIIFLNFIILFAIYSCQCLTKTVDLQILKFYLKGSTQFFENQDDPQDSQNSQNNQIDEAKVNQIILQLRIMVNIFVSRSEYISSKNFQPNSSVFHYDNWWSFFNQFTMNHKIYCKKVNCICSSFAFGKITQNEAIQNQVFTEKIYQLIKKIQVQSSEAISKKLKIIQSYLLVEIDKKPFKGYHQLVKLFSKPLTKSEMLEVESLLMETRDRFQMIFLKEKVRNSNLQIEPVFELETQVKQMRLQINQMASDYYDFYDIFANNFVEMEALKGKAKILSQHKNLFNQKFDYCLKKFNKSLDLVALATVYYKFFDEYTDRLNIVEKKAMFLYESYFNSHNKYKSKHIEVFDPHYGSVKIDLVFKVGKVVSISKNICHALGFSHREIEGQRVNKIMPHIFGRAHDKFLKNFIEKGSLKMLKQKQTMLYARNANKFMVPVSIKLKADFAQFDNFCVMALMKPVITKSEFIIMNNYGKIEEISQSLYQKLFQKTCSDQTRKIKRLCMSKMMLSLNYFLKDTKEKDETIHEGLLLISQQEQTLMNYYKFPELSIAFKKKQVSSSSGFSSRNSASLEANSSSSSRYSQLDLSDDMNQYTADMKQSLKDYLKKLDIGKVQGFRVSYRLKDYVTSEFKCKVLEIMTIWEEDSKTNFLFALKNQIINVAEFFGLEDHEYSKFKNMQPEKSKLSNDSQRRIQKKTQILLQVAESQNEINEQDQENVFNGLGNLESIGSSVCSLTEFEKQKQNVIAAFGSRIIISKNLEYGLASLILCMTIILIIVSIFSIGLKGNYIALQYDNLIITNFRINFLASLGIKQLQNFYSTMKVQPPTFLAIKKDQIDKKMKQCLMKSTEWISQSQQDYQLQITIDQKDRNYSQNRSILMSIMISYSRILLKHYRSKYITQNYVNFNNAFLSLTNKEEKLITQKSLDQKNKIDVVVIIHSLIMIAIGIICAFLKRIAFEKENKIIDFLPFFKAHLARKKARFFNLLLQFNKESENINANLVSQIEYRTKKEEEETMKQKKQQTHVKRQKKKKLKLGQKSESSSQLIRVIKNQKRDLSSLVKFAGIIVFLLAAFVIFFSEYFFSETHSKFEAYLKLKNSAFLVQSIPSRIILLYFININRALNDQSEIKPPEGFERLVHDRIFQLQLDLSNNKFSGLEMENVISKHFSQDICNLIKCEYDKDQSRQIYNQTLFYLSYRVLNSFEYMRKIRDLLPTFDNPKIQIEKWMREDNMYQVLRSTEFIIELMRKNEEEITNLFTDQIVTIGEIVLGISITLIPILIISLLMAKKKYIQALSNRLDCTENVYKHIGWEMLGQNTYAVNYFEEKLKMAKTF